jgi:gamma-glutamylcyclotransferase (GGCT)/AIG2-like uncharacterized protein YtfP
MIIVQIMFLVVVSGIVGAIAGGVYVYRKITDPRLNEFELQARAYAVEQVLSLPTLPDNVSIAEMYAVAYMKKLDELLKAGKKNMVKANG